MESKKVRVALIGCGYWGKNLARIIDENPQAELSMLCDLEIAKAERLNKIYTQSEIVDDWQNVVKNKQIDAVVVSTPVSTHFQIVSAAINGGKHVLCEKVLASSYEEVKHLIESSQKTGVVLLIGHTFLYNSAVRYIKSAIDKGEFGELLYLTFKRTGLGPIRNDVDVITDLATHDLSILHYWLGAPTELRAAVRNFLTNDLTDIAFLQCSFENGLVADLQASWLSPMKQRIIEVTGTKQMIVFDDVSSAEKIKIVKTGTDYHSSINDFGSFQLSIKDGDIIIPSLPYPEPLKEEFWDFINCIELGTTTNLTHSVALGVAQSLGAIKYRN